MGTPLSIARQAYCVCETSFPFSAHRRRPTSSSCAKGNEYRLNVRTAWRESAIYYDLGDWRAVRITSDGWEIEERPTILFKRFSAQKQQVEPERGGSILDILPLINIQDERLQLLYVTDLVAGLIPGIPRPVSIFHGPQGSAKSTALRYKWALVDPSEVPFLTIPCPRTLTPSRRRAVITCASFTTT